MPSKTARSSSFSTPPRGPPALADSRSLRRAALLHKVPYYTTLSGAVAAAQGIKAYLGGDLEVRALQSYFARPGLTGSRRTGVKHRNGTELADGSSCRVAAESVRPAMTRDSCRIAKLAEDQTEAMDKIPMTAAGHAALEDELKHREQVERPRIIQQITRRAHGRRLVGERRVSRRKRIAVAQRGPDRRA